MNQIEQLLRDQAGAAGFARAYLKYLAEVLAQLDERAIGEVVEVLLASRERGAQIFVIGNGGSAATASHMATDIGLGSRSWDRPFRISSLTDNVAALTAIANDYGYEDVFVRQLRTRMSRGDVVIAISASGNSPNVVAAVEYANRAGGVTVGLTGFDGGRLRQLCRLGVHVPSSRGEYGPVEDAHLVLDHIISAYLMHACSAEGT